MAATLTAPDTQAVSAVGQLLRGWRAARGMSQLDLAMHAGFSPRHVSFIETGRSQPSRQALLALAESLDVPLRERNRLLEAAGYAHVYRQTQLAADEMGHIRGVLQFILDRHAPYAAVVLDRYSTCLMGNQASAGLLAAIADPSLLTPPANLLRVAFHRSAHDASSSTGTRSRATCCRGPSANWGTPRRTRPQGLCSPSFAAMPARSPRRGHRRRWWRPTCCCRST
jgi:transcriptional regulator with XRE-family HTH domain